MGTIYSLFFCHSTTTFQYLILIISLIFAQPANQDSLPFQCQPMSVGYTHHFVVELTGIIFAERIFYPSQSCEHLNHLTKG